MNTEFRVSRAIYGRHAVFGHPPVVHVLNRLTVWNDSLYDATGSLVRASNYARGEQEDDRLIYRASAPEICMTGPLPGKVLPPDRYVWMGYFHGHFGHFLLSTLQRLWLDGLEDYVVLTPSRDCAEHLKTPFIKRLLTAAGVRKMMYVAPGTAIEEITIPEPAFVETSHVHCTWADFMERLAGIVSSPVPPGVSDQPLYLSRHRLAAGTRRLIGEEDVAGRLAARGVRIESPETLPIGEQIALWRTHGRIVGYNSSAMHGSAFTQGRSVGVLSPSMNLYSNQTMIDAVRGHRAWYLNAADALDDAPHDRQGFGDAQVIRDPAGYADAVLRIFDAMERPGRLAKPASSAFLTPVPNTPFQTERASGKDVPESVPGVVPGAGGGSGLVVSVNGTAGAATREGDTLRIDLPQRLRLTEIRLFDAGVQTSFLERRLGVDPAMAGAAIRTDIAETDGLERVLFRWTPDDVQYLSASSAVRVALPPSPAGWQARLEVFGLEV